MRLFQRSFRVSSFCCAEFISHDSESRRESTKPPVLRVPRAKTRLHVNPLSPELLGRPLEVPDFQTLFADTCLPLHLDLGCAYGEFCLQLAEQSSSANFLGIDLRDRVLDRARAVAADKGRRRNVAFLSLNIRHPHFLHTLLAEYKGPLVSVTCLFPDPWRQQSERRKRLLQPELASSVAEVMSPGGTFVTATDCLELAIEMRSCFDDPQRWRNAATDASGFMSQSPFSVRTAWEATVQGRRSPIYWTQHVRHS